MPLVLAKNENSAPLENLAQIIRVLRRLQPPAPGKDVSAMIEARRKTCKCGAIMEISLNIQEGKLLSSIFGNCFPVGDFCWNLARVL